MDIKEESLKFHEGGKFKTTLKKDITNKEDLSLAYTPGVANACLEIKRDPSLAYKYTSKGNTVAVISDGTAVLGLGDIGPLAGIPVMEGKANLFKKFADIDAIPLCINTKNVEEIIQVCKALEPSLGGINLEDISAPRCVEIERRLIKEMNIPVMHDDQHGTSIVVAAAVINASRFTHKNISNLTVVLSGTGAAGSNIARMLKRLGVKAIYASNKDGVVDIKNYDSYDFLIKELLDDHIIDTKEGHDNTLASLLKDSNVFIGVSAPNLVTSEMVSTMKDPFVFAMANPNPEISYADAIKGGALVAGTGRSDFPNQVNNLLAFPGIFRGALDSNACKITEGMKLKASYAIANLISDSELRSDYILPDAFDPRVVKAVSEAVKAEAILEGVCRK